MCDLGKQYLPKRGVFNIHTLKSAMYLLQRGKRGKHVIRKKRDVLNLQ